MFTFALHRLFRAVYMISCCCVVFANNRGENEENM
jgi:hypothetical protein